MLRRYNLSCEKCNRKMVFGGYQSKRKKHQDIKEDKNRPFFLCPVCINEPDIRTPTDWKNLTEPPKNPNW